MQGIFDLMYEGDIYVGTFEIDSEKNKWVYNADGLFSEQPLVFRLQLKDQEGKILIGDVVRDWLITRAPEPNYTFIDALMERAGITEYDPLAFVMYNSGRFNTDRYYLTQA